ncbi:hypothetical protein BH23ACT9_BH23ACT9_30590 [soil metagenome]
MRWTAHMAHPTPRIAVALTAGLLLLTACGSADDDAAPAPTVTTVPVPTITQPATPDPTPAASPTPTPTPEASPTDDAEPTEGADAEASLSYFLVVEGGGRFFVEPVAFGYDPSTADGAVARTALSALLSAGSEDHLLQLLPAGTELLDVAIDGRVLVIDLSEEMAANPGVGGEGEAAVAQALAHTGAQFPEIDAIRLLVEGEPVTDLWGHVDWSSDIEPDEFALVPIHIAEATPISSGGGSIELSGSATVFEATFDLELADAAGNIVETDFVTADCGGPCRGAWTHTFADLGPGEWTVIARQPDPSDGEGFAPYEVARTVTIPG